MPLHKIPSASDWPRESYKFVIPQRRHRTVRNQSVTVVNVIPLPADNASNGWSPDSPSHQSDTDSGLGKRTSPEMHRHALGHIKASSMPSMSVSIHEPFTIRNQLSAQAKPFDPTFVSPLPEQSQRPHFSPMPHSDCHSSHPSHFHPLQDQPPFSTSHHAPLSFKPNHHSHFQQGESNNALAPSIFDPYAPSTNSLAAGPHTPHQTQINPYTQDSTASGGTSYFQDSSYTQPLQYHLYTALGPHREAIHPHQRNARDFFISDTLREELQKKAAAAHQVLPREWSPIHPSLS